LEIDNYIEVGVSPEGSKDMAIDTDLPEDEDVEMISSPGASEEQDSLTKELVIQLLLLIFHFRPNLKRDLNLLGLEESLSSLWMQTS
jgi:hypothetical protein